MAGGDVRGAYTNNLRRRGAANVAGYAGPGFHNWPRGRIPQDADGKEAVRIRSPAKISFGEAFGEVTYAAFLQNADLFFRVDSQGWHPGLVCDALSGHGVGTGLGHMIGNVLILH